MKVSHLTKLEIIRLHRQGLKVSRIVKDLNSRGNDITRDHVQYWISQFNEGRFLPGEDFCEQGPSCTSTSDIQAEVDKLEQSLQQDGMWLCPTVHNQLVKEGSSHSISTTRQLIKAVGYKASTPRYGQMVQAVNKEKRVAFCRSLIEKDNSPSDIIFTDELSISLEISKPVVYHRNGTSNPVIPKPKHPAKVHVWGGISRLGATQIAIFQGIMEKTFFTTEILGNGALPFISSVYPEGHRFQQDNDPKHRSKIRARN